VLSSLWPTCPTRPFAVVHSSTDAATAEYSAHALSIKYSEAELPLACRGAAERTCLQPSLYQIAHNGKQVRPINPAKSIAASVELAGTVWPAGRV
jgi:hypothetical protein